MGKVLKTFGVLAVVLAFSLYSPPPSGIAEPGRLSMFNAVARAARFTGIFLRYMGLSEEYLVQRYYIDLSSKFVEGYQPEMPHIKVTDTKFDGVPVRIYEPLERENDKLPALVFIHGGGWVTMSVETYHETTLDIANMLGQVVLISVDYELSPENTFPGPVDECYRATKWILEHADDYGIDANRIGMAGDSAGGNLVASVVLQMKFNKIKPKLKTQVLIYPVLQPLDFSLPSYQQNKYAFDGVISTNYMPYYWLLYAIGEAPKNLSDAMLEGQVLQAVKQSSYKHLAKHIHHAYLPEKVKQRGFIPKTEVRTVIEEVPNSLLRVFLHPYFSPLLADDLSGLPNTHIITAEFDVLRDDGILYAKRLKSAGVEVTFNNVRDGFHGMLTFGFVNGGFEVGQKLRRDFAEGVKKTL
ncbi:arylacetamide deacetylase-like [Glandiceps talaboti]